VISDSKPSVFVVDDDAIIASTLVIILQRHGYKATSFTGPTEALAAARRESPDILISDVNMPGLTGIELAILMRAQYPKLQVLLLSGNPASRQLLEHARSRGYDLQMLLKPINPSDLLKHIGKLVVMPGYDGAAQEAPLNMHKPQALMSLEKGE
jgi:CheY-like chemotaxis protein